jgi:hypothetical protein
MDEARLKSIEVCVAGGGKEGMAPASWTRDLCAALRAAWKERDEAIEIHGRCQVYALKVQGELKLLREQVRQLQVSNANTHSDPL